ncbi:hypothetical protein N9Y85_02475 [Paracoccaceae bacterium]|nr:hypothetical protein [Paracoccaceae bacterium]
MTIKRVRGLFDYMELKEGEQWEWEPPSEDYVAGMGFGASKEATRWAYKGYLLENAHALRAISSQKTGRPRKGKFEDIGSRRAYAIWQYVQNNVPEELRAGVTNRKLIGTMQSIQNALEQTMVEHDRSLFPMNEAGIEFSVSRGKSKLRIDKIWNSKVCEKLMSTLSQTTN